MLKFWLCLSIGTSVLWACVGVSMGASAGPVIQRVNHVKAALPQPTDSPTQLKLSKFFQEAESPEVFRVHWAPGESGVPAGVVLRFSYQHERLSRWQSLEIQYPFAVRDNRIATFEVSSKAVSRAGAVVVWRVELLERGRQLAATESTNRRRK